VLTEVLQQVINGLIMGSTYALTAVGLTMIFGMMHVVNFTHGEFYMLGGFFAFQLTALLQLNYYLSVALAILAVMAVGFVCERVLLAPLREKSIDTTVLVTIGLSIFLQNLALLYWGPTPKSIPLPFSNMPLRWGPMVLTWSRILAVVITFGLIVLVHLLIQKSLLGKAMRATFQEKDAARLAGIDVERIYALTFTLGAGLAAGAGALLGSIFLIYPSMGNIAILKAFIVVILGGMGNFLGAIAGGLILGVAEGLGAGFVSSGYKDAIGFVLVILILMFRPSGLFGKARRL
jgi:branched-chain amino acid transport system permease protein